MIRKSGYRFSEKIMREQQLKRNVWTQNHFALGALRKADAHWIS
jgi:hypothetical protein